MLLRFLILKIVELARVYERIKNNVDNIGDERKISFFRSFAVALFVRC